MAGKSDLIDIALDIVAETKLAYCLSDGGDEEIWVPKSQVEKNDDGTFTMQEWLAFKKGFI